MKEGFYFAEFSGRNTWSRLVHKHPAGQETVIRDFIRSNELAQRFARQENIRAESVRSFAVEERAPADR